MWKKIIFATLGFTAFGAFKAIAYGADSAVPVFIFGGIVLLMAIIGALILSAVDKFRKTGNK